MRGTAACGITVSRSDLFLETTMGLQGSLGTPNTTHSQLGKSDHPSMDLEQPKLLNPIFRKNQYLLILFCSVRYRAVKVTKASWFHRKSLGLERYNFYILERITSIKNICMKYATAGTNC